jgi:hypothetical protein
MKSKFLLNFNLNKIQILDQHLKILIVGLGGGALTMYCKTWLRNVN